MNKIKKVGFLYDNISKNTGDLAIGLSIQKMLLDIGLSKNDFEEMIPGVSNPQDYENIIIGGGLLLRNRGDFFYDKFRMKGNYILNCMGIYQNPKDLVYLNEYKYLTVRSEGDKDKIKYLKKEINVIPDTTLLLEDIDIKITIRKPSIGIHCFSKDNFNQINEVIKKYSKDFYIYLLPITHYNYDFEFLEKIYLENINNEKVFLLPIMSPLEIFTIIGKFNYFISYSLHGAYFAYRHNVPFILLNDKGVPKMKEFMKDRKIEKYLFTESTEIDSVFKKLIKEKIDYSKLLKKDLEILENHKQNIAKIIFNSKKSFNKNKNTLVENSFNFFSDNFNKKLKNKIFEIKQKNEEIINQSNKEKENLQKKIIQLQSDLNKIQSSKTYKVWQKFNKMKKVILKKKD